LEQVIERHQTKSTNSTQIEREKIKKWTVEILAGLKFIHRVKREVVHLNIRPEKIFLKHDTVKLGDISIARDVNSISSHSKPTALLYASPELTNGQEFNQKSDIW
jgi:aurora kinase A